MNTTQAQQKALDDALVALADRLEFEKCNMRLKTDIKPKKATFQMVLDALALTPFYQAFLITADVPAIYMQEFWATVSVHKSSIRFTINKKKFSLNVDMFREILQLCPKILGQKFEDLPLEHDILSFIRDLWHSGYIIYLTDVNVDYLHQPWRAFSIVINKCLSGKETGMDKIHFLFQIENKDAKKTNKMSYLRFIKVIIDYFMSKDQHEDTQVYEKAPKPKYVRKKADSDTSPKKKTVQATKGSRLKSKAKVAKSDKKKQPAEMPKAKGINVLFESKVPDEQQKKVTGTNKGAGVTPEVPDVPKYDLESEESWILSHPVMGPGRKTCVRGRFKQEEEDAHVTLTPVLDTQKSGGPTQSYYVSSDFTSKLLNLDNPSPADNEIASLMDTTAQHVTAIPKITSSFTTTNPPPPLFFNPLSQQATPTLTPTASETTTSHPTLLDFASIFKFNERVFNLEKDLSEMKQVDQYAQALSSIPAIDEKNAYIELVDTSMRAIIKEEVNTQLPQILPQVVSDFVNPVIEKNVTESVEAAVLTRSSSQPTSTYKAVASLSEFELTKILIDKMEKNKSYDKSDNTDNDLFDLFGEVFSLKRIRDESDKDRDPFAESD
ncbi:hypothetical protein Tco_0998222 [Tanacetum coccineum]